MPLDARRDASPRSPSAPASPPSSRCSRGLHDRGRRAGLHPRVGAHRARRHRADQPGGRRVPALRAHGHRPRDRRQLRPTPSDCRTFLARNVPDDDEMLVALRRRRTHATSPRTATARTSSTTRTTWLPWRPARRRRHGRGPGRRVRRGLGHRGPGASATSEAPWSSSTSSTTSTPSSAARCAPTRSWRCSRSADHAVAAGQSGRLLAPLRTLRETARDITATDLSRRIPETGNDDITALTLTFNEMLDRLEDGVRGAAPVPRRRRARARTPLTIVRGHLELLDSDDPADVERPASWCSTRWTGCRVWWAT